MKANVLSDLTLVLNKAWISITAVTVREAIVSVVNEASRIIDPESYQLYDFDGWYNHTKSRTYDKKIMIRTGSLQFPAPEIIVLTRYSKVPYRGVPFSRKNLYARDSYRCQYCGATPGIKRLTIDHIMPRSRGGKSSWINCVLCCGECNMRKGNKTLKELGWKLKQTPKAPTWSPLFQIKKDDYKESWRKFL